MARMMGSEGFAFEDAAECFDGVIGEFGEVGEGSLPEEDGGGRVPVGQLRSRMFLVTLPARDEVC